jgi:uncharacterized repeat protein (TIGR01451 family)
MKIKITLLIMVFCFFISPFVFSQTTVTIIQGNPSSYDQCVIPQNISFTLFGHTTGSLPNDSILLYIDFGDGADTAFYSGDSAGIFYFNGQFSHPYLLQGNYTITYIATGTSGVADTLIQLDQVILSATCDTLAGKVFADSNLNCFPDAGEALLHGIPVKIMRNGLLASTINSDINGYYSYHWPTGFTYDIIVDTSNVTVFDITCPPNGIYSNVTATGFAFNFGLLCSLSVVHFSSLQANAYNPCIYPQNIQFNGSGTTLGYQPHDTIIININFGDGTNTTIYCSDSSYLPSFNFNVTHNYSLPGIYSLICIATGPDGIADTLIQQNQIELLSTCGNLSGEAFVDNNSNCIHDIGETPMALVPIHLFKNGQINQVVFTDTAGIFSFLVPPGYTYDVAIDLSNQTAFNLTCPVGGIYNNTGVPASNLNFGLMCSNTGFDMIGSYSGLWFHPGVNTTFWIHVKNQGCITQSGQVKLALDTLLNYISSNPVPASFIGDTLIWNYSNLTPFNEFIASIYVQTDINAVNCDSNVSCDTIHLKMIITPVSGDLNPLNNIVDTSSRVRNSFDPNMKDVSPAGVGQTGFIPPDTKLTYTIYFQNCGNDTAYNIFIMDTLDENLDVETFQLLSSSHAVDPIILQGKILKFNFNHIMLPDSNINVSGSNGYVTYSIHTKNSLADGTPIVNTAYIYFDYNPAVMTNTVINTISDPLGTEEQTGGMTFLIFPNPMHTQTVIYLNTPAIQTANMHLTIYDMTGRKVKEMGNLSGNQIMFNRDGISNGIFFFKLTDDKNFVVGQGKIIIL